MTIICIVLQVLLAWYIVDLFTAIYHLFVDNIPNNNLPFLGQQVADFQLHHVDPKSFLQNSFGVSSRETLLSALFPLAFAYWLPWFCIPLALGMGFSQQIHKWAHEDNVPDEVKLLQKYNIFLRLETHNDHHTHFKRSYGILNGWSNELLNFILRKVFKHG